MNQNSLTTPVRSGSTLPFVGGVVILDCQIVRQKGSHVKLKKKLPPGEKITIVPLHKEFAHGTLHGILRLAAIEYDNFISKK